jgi:hypothetical protein
MRMNIGSGDEKNKGHFENAVYERNTEERIGEF